MIDAGFVFLGALIAIVGNVAYAWDTFRGCTKPNRVTWGLWALAPLIAFAAELGQGVGSEAVLTLAVGLGPLLVFVASFRDPAAYGRMTRLDTLCAALSLLALAGWALTGTGDVAIVLSIMSDCFGAIPTIHKAAHDPSSESASAFICGTIGSAIAMLAIRASEWGFATAAFPAYITCVNALLAVLILLPRSSLGRRRGLQ